jgi:hypothetical protein
VVVRDAGRGRAEHIPTLEHLGDLQDALGVDEQLARREWDQRRVDVHRVRVVELEDVYGVLVPEVAAQPLNAELVRDVALLREDVAAAADEVGGVEGRLELRDD